MNDARAAWVALENKCEELGLPQPKLYPSRLGDKFTVEIINFTSSGNPLEAINSGLDFVGGYEMGMKATSKQKYCDVCGSEVHWTQAFGTDKHCYLCHTCYMRLK